MGIQTFDGRRAVLVGSREIRVGDWLRDQGRLRQAESIETADFRHTLGVLVRFSDSEDGPYATLSVPDGVTVTVWRMAAETAGAARV